ncbi:MAG: ribosome maturation factor RimM [Gammaproteobacteria bacterium]|nr:MAG: ribosome maturation factor RimM [Gammaproteobacteria bacterium]
MQQPESPSAEQDAGDGSEKEGESRRRIILGRISGVYGIKGWVKVHSDTTPRENILEFARWMLGRRGEWREVAVTAGRPQGKTLVARIEGVDTPEAAQLLVGNAIAVWRDDLPPIDEGEYYWTDLIGLAVVTTEGVEVGTVKRLFETGANDVLVVSDEREGRGGQEVLVPWVLPDVIVEVDLAGRRIRIDWDPDF